MRKSLSIFILVSMFAVNDKSGVPIKKEFITVDGERPAQLKTTNGCGAYAFFIANKGDTNLHIPATIGHISCSYGVYHYEVQDSFPGFELIDFAYPAMMNQNGLSQQEIRYFAGVTSSKIYLFENYLTDPCEPAIERIDSVATPSGYVSTTVNDQYQLLVISGQGTSQYQYTFYDLPDLSIDSQLTLSLKPDRIIAYNNYQGDSYIICGDSAGIQKMVRIDAGNRQILYDIVLPPEASNTREIFSNNNDYYLLTSPGDSETFLIKIATIDTSITKFQLLDYSGINVSTIQTEYYGGFEFQPLTGSFDKQIFLVDINQNNISDTFYLNKKLIALHANDATGFGNDIYQLIMGTDDTTSLDSVYMSSNIYLSDSYSILAGAKPTWFAEDLRCYAEVNTIEQNLSIDVYPNPVSGEVQILAKHLASGKTYHFDITDLNGKVLWEEEIIAKEHYTVPLQEFPAGVLILRIDAGTKIVVKKIIKQ